MTLRATLWSVNLSQPVSSLGDWAARIERQITATPADLLILPEYASEQWMHFAPPLAPTRQIGWMAAQTPGALPLLQALAQKHKTAIAAGTFAAAAADATPPFHNRAHVFLPDGRVITQNKLCMTPKEKNPEGWNLSTGDTLGVFEYKDFRMAVVVCLDIELPALSARMAGLGIDLLIVPSMTKTLAGYHRVYDCAKARAVELQAAVAVCGAIGGGPARQTNISGASFFLPCEEELGATGTLATLPPVRETADTGLLLTADLPLSQIRRLRADIGKSGAEVWPGAWDAAHVSFSG